MNVVFLSPNFPPQFHLFCAALRARGARVLGVGEASEGELSWPLRQALTDYVHVPRMADYDLLLRAAALLSSRHGKIDRVDSLNEHWLGLEARLRDDFNVPGPRPAQIARHRSKTGMDAVFRAAGLDPPRSAPLGSLDEARAFAAQAGYPLVIKPDLEVGAQLTHKVEDQAELERVIGGGLEGYVVQEYVPGAVTSYDGLADRDGRVIFALSFVYSSGVMDIVNHQLDVHYYSRRRIPPALERMGREVVSAFGIRAGFFHCEFFELPGGAFRPLEINLRPPGGFTTDLMNYACDADVYALWADLVTGGPAAGSPPEPGYHAAHASRRQNRAYRLPEGELRAALGDTLVLACDMPYPFSVAMGHRLFILRHPELSALERAIALVHARP